MKFIFTILVALSPIFLFSQSEALNKAFTTFDALAKQEKYKEALPYAKESLHLARIELKETQYYRLFIFAVAETFQKLGEADSALVYITEFRDETLKYFGNKSPEYGASLNQLGNILIDLLEYEQAIKACLQAEELLRNVVSFERDYISTVNNLGYSYHDLGNYQNARLYYNKALEATRLAYGEKSDVYSTLLNNVADFHKDLGDINSAYELYEKALKILEEIGDTRGFSYINKLANLASLQVELTAYEPASETIVKAMRAINRSKNDYYLIRSSLHSSLAEIEGYNKDYKEADKNYKQAITYSALAVGKHQERTLKKEQNLAVFYIKQQKPEKALPILLQIKQEIGSQLGEEHPTYKLVMRNLAVAYEDMGQIEKVIPIRLESSEEFINEINSAFAFLSENEKKSFLTSIEPAFNAIMEMTVNYGDQYPELVSASFNMQLAQKGAILSTSKNILTDLRDLNMPKVNEEIDAYLELQNKVAALNQQSTAKKGEKEQALEDELARKKQELTLIHAQHYKKQTSVDWKDLQRNLDKDEVLLDFTQYSIYKNYEIDSTVYGVFVLKKKWKSPKFIYVTSNKKIDAILERGNAEHIFNDTRGASAASVQQPVSALSELYQLVINPLEEDLADVKRVRYSPSGVLHKLPFSALRSPDKRYLSEIFELVQVNDFGSREENAKKQSNLFSNVVLMGGITFSLEKEPLIPTWASLPGTAAEVNALAAILEKQAGTQTNLVKGKSSTEVVFKDLVAQQPSICHLATHGYFLPYKSQFFFEKAAENQFENIRDPLYRSGLIMAGGNDNWGKEVDVPSDQDGILTAEEISHLNMQNTNLVVLSACETGLGDISNSEGVYGLQRAFRMAGVSKLVVSLWQVPDAETAEYMQLFYEALLSTQNVETAFNTAQQNMRNKYYDSPYKWAAFVLVN